MVVSYRVRFLPPSPPFPAPALTFRVTVGVYGSGSYFGTRFGNTNIMPTPTPIRELASMTPASRSAARAAVDGAVPELSDGTGRLKTFQKNPSALGE